MKNDILERGRKVEKLIMAVCIPVGLVIVAGVIALMIIFKGQDGNKVTQMSEPVAEEPAQQPVQEPAVPETTPEPEPTPEEPEPTPEPMPEEPVGEIDPNADDPGVYIDENGVVITTAEDLYEVARRFSNSGKDTNTLLYGKYGEKTVRITGTVQKMTTDDASNKVIQFKVNDPYKVSSEDGENEFTFDAVMNEGGDDALGALKEGDMITVEGVLKRDPGALLLDSCNLTQ